MAAKNRPVFLIIVALVVGLVAALMAQRWLQGRLDATRAEAEAGIVSVVVANKDIAFGEKLTSDQVTTALWPVESVGEENIRDVKNAVGKVAASAIFAGEPVTTRRAVDPLQSSLLSTRIAENMRAVTVRVDDVAGVAGFLLPGSKIDVVASKRVEGGSSRNFKTRTVLQNITVLAVDQRASSGGEDQPVVVRAVTVEVTPRQAEKLVKATQEGEIQLVMRNPKDITNVELPEEPDPEMAESEQQRFEFAPPPDDEYEQYQQPPKDPANSISVIRGTVSETTQVKKKK